MTFLLKFMKWCVIAIILMLLLYFAEHHGWR